MLVVLKGRAWRTCRSYLCAATLCAATDTRRSAMRALRATPEADGQTVQAANDEGFNVRQRARFQQPKVVESRQEPLDADACLGAGQTGAGTEVLAVTEGDVTPGIWSLGVEAVGVFKNTRAAVGGADHGHHDGPRRKLGAGQARIAEGEAEGAFDGTLEAQALLDEVRNRRGIASKLLNQGGLLAEDPHSRAEQARRGLLPGGEEDCREADDVHYLGELAIAESNARQPAHDVVAGRRAALLDVAGEVWKQVREHLIAHVPSLGISDGALLAPQPAAERLVVFARDPEQVGDHEQGEGPRIAAVELHLAAIGELADQPVGEG